MTHQSLLPTILRFVLCGVVLFCCDVCCLGVVVGVGVVSVIVNGGDGVLGGGVC